MAARRQSGEGKAHIAPRAGKGMDADPEAGADRRASADSGPGADPGTAIGQGGKAGVGARGKTAKAKAPATTGSTAVPDPHEAPDPVPFNILAIGQRGRIGFEALALAASLRRASPDFPGRLIIAEPQPEAAWAGEDTRMPAALRAALEAFGAEITPFTATRFGRAYPPGNKIEALAVLPEGEPFLFLDSDTLILGDLARVRFDFARPSASMRRTGTWPVPPLYGPGYGAIWRSLYDRFGLDYAATLDLAQPDEHWERYLYFNAGWFLGADPRAFGQRFGDWAQAVLADPGDALACQRLDVHLDQIVLPLVIHSLGGGRPGAELAGMDGAVTCHYRYLSLLYARESDAAVAAMEALADETPARRALRDWGAFRQLVLRKAGARRIRPMFDRDDLPPEAVIRKALKQAGYWSRD